MQLMTLISKHQYYVLLLQYQSLSINCHCHCQWNMRRFDVTCYHHQFA